MKVALLGNTLLIKDANDEQRAEIESWNRMDWNAKTQIFSGAADLELLSRLAEMGRLPAGIADYRSRLRTVQDAVDRERVKESPASLYDYPVTMPLYAHQMRGTS